jgi:hypothetical protein
MTGYRCRYSLPLAVAVVVTGAVGPVGPAAAGPAAEPVGGVAAGCAWRLDTRLPVPAGFTSASVSGTDGVGVFVGTATSFDLVDISTFVARAVVWRGGRMSVLPTPDGWSSFGYAVNRRGDVAGTVFPNGGQPGPVRPVLWRHGVPVELAVPAGADVAIARDVNDSGLVAGVAFMADGSRRPLLWSATQPDSFRVVQAPTGFNFVNALTEHGVLAGVTDSVDEPVIRSRPVAGTEASGLHLLPDPPGGFSSIVNAANGDFLVGDFVRDDGEIRPTAVLWHNEVPQVLSKDFSSAQGVNSHGAATGFNDSIFGPVVWIGGDERKLPLVGSGPAVTSGSGFVITEDSRTVGGSVTPADAPSASLPVLWHCR